MLQAQHDLSGFLRAEESPICPICTHVRDFVEGAFNTFVEIEQMEYTGYCAKMIDQT
jgi:hypothetical protein